MAYFWHACDSPTCVGAPNRSSRQQFRLGAILVTLLLFAGVEWLAGYASHSLALRSDAWHLVADSGAILLALSASGLMRLAVVRRLPGRPRLDAIAAFTNSLGLIVMAGAIAWEAIQHLTQPPQQILSGPMFLTATIGLVVNAIAIGLLHEDSQSDLNVRGAFLHVVADLASSVGVLVAAIAIYAFHCFWLDSAIGLLIALFIAASAVPLLRLSWLRSRKLQGNASSSSLNHSTIPEIGRTNLSDLIVHQATHRPAATPRPPHKPKM